MEQPKKEKNEKNKNLKLKNQKQKINFGKTKETKHEKN